MPEDSTTAAAGEFDQMGRSAEEALTDMVSTLSRSGLVCPVVPVPLYAQLAVSRERHGWAWGTSNVFRSFEVYLWPRSFLTKLLSPETPDLFLFGHRGHGQSSYGLGLTARYGPVAVAQQIGWGGTFMDRARSTAAANAAATSWSVLAERVDELAEDDPSRADELEFAVVYSNFRDEARLMRRLPGDPDPENRERGVPLGWEVVADLGGFGHAGDDVVLERQAERPGIGGEAAQHLLRLVEAGQRARRQ